MAKARKLGVPTPVLYAVDPLLHTLTFEYVDGLSVKDILLGFGSAGVNEERLNDIATQIGNAVGKLHDGGLIHGDLTTSNMIIKNSNNQLVGTISFSSTPSINVFTLLNYEVKFMIIKISSNRPGGVVSLLLICNLYMLILAGSY